jgi:hypothetical protein
MTTRRPRFTRWLVVLVLLALGAETPAADRPEVGFRTEPGRLRIAAGSEPIATYVYRDPAISRPFFESLSAPGGVQVSRNNPPIEGQDPIDHPTFHPGLWLAFGDLDGADSWRLKARVEHEAFVEGPSGRPGEGEFTVRNRYLAADGGATICRETCRYSVLVRPTGYLLISVSDFRSDDHDFAFGDQEEMGFGVRVATPLIVKNGGRILNSDGLKDGKEVWGKPADWCDFSGTIDGRHAGVTLMTDPENFRPSWFHARDYGLLVANPFGRKAMTKGEPSRVVVKRGEPFRLGFAILLHASDGPRGPDLAAAYRDYLAWIAPRKPQ